MQLLKHSTSRGSWYHASRWRWELDIRTHNLTNWFHVAMHLFRNRWWPSVSLNFLPHYEVFRDLILSRRTTTCNLFILYNDQKGKKTSNLPCTAWLFEDMCQLRYFPSYKRYLSSLLILFIFILLVDCFHPNVFHGFHLFSILAGLGKFYCLVFRKKSSTSSDLSLLYVGSSHAGRRPSVSRRGSGGTVFGTGTRFKSQSESEKGPLTNQPELGVFHLNL